MLSPILSRKKDFYLAASSDANEMAMKWKVIGELQDE
jgi:hypothetical protein